jgi:hypothetical protein
MKLKTKAESEEKPNAKQNSDRTAMHPFVQIDLTAQAVENLESYYDELHEKLKKSANLADLEKYKHDQVKITEQLELQIERNSTAIHDLQVAKKDIIKRIAREKEKLDQLKMETDHNTQKIADNETATDALQAEQQEIKKTVVTRNDNELAQHQTVLLALESQQVELEKVTKTLTGNQKILMHQLQLKDYQTRLREELAQKSQGLKTAFDEFWQQWAQNLAAAQLLKTGKLQRKQTLKEQGIEGVTQEAATAVADKIIPGSGLALQVVKKGLMLITQHLTSQELEQKPARENSAIAAVAFTRENIEALSWYLAEQWILRYHDQLSKLTYNGAQGHLMNH